VKSSGWRSLKPYPLEEKWDNVLPVGPADRHRQGVLSNGMRYYVHRAQKPKDRAALALAVDVGSVAEEEDERGVAHLVEHLAFRATQNFGNFEIVRFLESIGAEFGPCQNAYTSMDETVYELLVPIDDAGSKNLTKALAVLSEFASRVRISDADVNDERGAVLEEMRMGRDARGRASEAYWKLLMKDSLYAERLPIGLESVIKKGNPAVFRRFYEKWYRPERMAVIAAGDFPDLDAVVNEIENAFGKCAPAPGQPHVNPATPRPPVAFHASPRVTCSVDKEHTKTTVTLTFKYPANPISTPGDFFQKTVEEAFKLALDNRLYKLMRKADPPFFSAGCSVEEATRTVSVFSAQISCEEGKKSVVRGLEAGLRELARARVHGFSEQELKIARAKQIADAQQFFVERDQTYCTSLRDELAGHFLRGELVVGAEEEARMTIACVERMTVEDLRVFAQRCRLDASCVIRAMEGRATVKEADIAAAAAKIQDEENRGAIAKNGAFDVPETLVDAGRLPAPGGVVETTAFSKMGFNVSSLANGVRVATKTTDFLDDQVLVRAFARGGLSEVPEKQYLDALYAGTIAGELGMFGLRPETLFDALAGKRADVAAKTGTYFRRVDGDTSPTDIETGLQLMYMLFTQDVRSMLVPEELEAVLRMQEQAIRNRNRDPASVYNQTIRRLVYGKTFQSAPLRVADVRKMQPMNACEHFNAAFADPSQFTVVLVGAFDEKRVLKMCEKYLGCITPPPKTNVSTSGAVIGDVWRRDDFENITPAPFTFPKGAVTREIRSYMVEPMSMASITFPVNIKNPDWDVDRKTSVVTVDGSVVLTREKLLCVFATSIIERRLLALLRFKFGEIYTCAASASFAFEDPLARGALFRGDVMINFSCDPAAGKRLARLALEDIKALQLFGPTVEEVATAVEVETRALEVREQENAYWRDYYEAVHNSRLRDLLDGDLDALFSLSEKTRRELMAALTPEMIKEHLQRCLDVRHRVVVVLRPQRPLWRRALLPDPTTAEGLAVLSLYGVAAGAAAYLRLKKKAAQ
jgi:predicted Zn-dependent peptidase